MKINRVFYFLFFFLTFFSSCNNAKKEEKKAEISSENVISAEIKAIDEETATNGQLASSLLYTDESGASYVAFAHLNVKGELLKIEEKYTESGVGNYGTNTFYLAKGKIIATREYFEDKKSGENVTFVDRISYYLKNEKVDKSFEKRVNFEEELESIDYSPCEVSKIEIAKAQRALNQQGEFITTFQGFVISDNLTYLIVGNKNSVGYTSAIRISNQDGFIQFISKEPKKYLNRKIQVTFEKIVDQTGFEYQSYIQGSFVD